MRREWDERAAKVLEKYLETHELRAGAGGAGTESLCSMEAINHALTGAPDDRIPDCMSQVTGMWIMNMQDLMPARERNSGEWKGLLPKAAATDRTREKERTDALMAWVLETLPQAAREETQGGEEEFLLKLETNAGNLRRTHERAGTPGEDECTVSTASILAGDTARDLIYLKDWNPERRDGETLDQALERTERRIWGRINPAEALERMIAEG